MGRLHARDDRLDLLHEPGELALVDHVTIHLNPLADVRQVRAGVQPDLVPAGLQHRRDHRASAAFALGSGDVDRLEIFVRIAEAPQERAHAIQVEILARVTNDAQALVVAEAHEVTQGLGVAVNSGGGGF